jgi:hypothetical protein
MLKKETKTEFISKSKYSQKTRHTIKECDDNNRKQGDWEIRKHNLKKMSQRG